MKKKSLIIASCSILLVTSLSVFMACQKEDSLIKNQDKSVTIPFFKNAHEYSVMRNKVFSFSHKELKAYELSNGYESFGRACEDLYYSIDPKDFKSVDQIKQYVEKHKEYLQLIEGSDGELTLEVVDHNNPYRYFINTDRLFQIDTVVYKVVGDYIMSAPISSISKLKSINLGNISSIKSDTEVHLMNYKIAEPSDRLKDATYNCGTNPGDGQVTNGSERVITTLGIYMDDVVWAGTCLYSHYIVRGYHKVIFWFRYDRDLSTDIDIAEDYYINAWNRIQGSFVKNFDSIQESAIEGDLGYSWVCTPGYCPHNFHFGGYVFKAQSEYTDEVTISCHPELF